MSYQIQPEGQTKCYPVAIPALVILNRSFPSVLEVIAFAFDIYTTPVKVPIRAINPRNRSDESIDSIADTWLKFFENALLHWSKKLLGNIPIKIDKVDYVFSPLCSTAYVVLRVTGTPGVRATIKPILISSSYNQAIQYVSAVAVGGLRSTARSTSYTIAQAPVQFYFTPEQVTSFMFSVLR